MSLEKKAKQRWYDGFLVLLPAAVLCTSFLLLSSGGEHNFPFPLCNKLGTNTKIRMYLLNVKKYEPFCFIIIFSGYYCVCSSIPFLSTQII